MKDAYLGCKSIFFKKSKERIIRKGRTLVIHGEGDGGAPCGRVTEWVF